MHPLLLEYKELVINDYGLCDSHCERSARTRLYDLERELTEALEYAALIGDNKAAVKEAEEELTTKRRAYQNWEHVPTEQPIDGGKLSRVTWYRKGGTPEVPKPTGDE